MSTMYVKSAPGLKMPKEGAPRSYISDSEAQAVTASHFYRKAVTDGDLVELTKKQWDAIVTDRAKAESAAAKAAIKETK